MKNGLLIWNVVLTVAAAVLFILHFSGSKSATAPRRTGDSTLAGGPFRIGYFEMDSIENNYEMVKDVKAEISKKEDQYNKAVNELGVTYNNRRLSYQQKAQTMTEADAQAATQDLQQLEKSLQNRRQALDQEYQDFVSKLNISLKKRIEDYIATFNADRRYAYIVAADQGFFYYKDSTYDITAQVIKGLNETYKPKKD